MPCGGRRKRMSTSVAMTGMVVPAQIPMGTSGPPPRVEDEPDHDVGLGDGPRVDTFHVLVAPYRPRTVVCGVSTVWPAPAGTGPRPQGVRPHSPPLFQAGPSGGSRDDRRGPERQHGAAVPSGSPARRTRV